MGTRLLTAAVTIALGVTVLVAPASEASPLAGTPSRLCLRPCRFS